MTRIRIFIFAAILAGGAVLLFYGLADHRISVVKGPVTEESRAAVLPGDVLTLPESDVVKDTTLGGVVRHSEGRLQRTYGGEKKPAQFCPT
jgi:hypothetical protein